MLTEKQKMKEELNSVLAMEFIQLEELAREYHQKKREFRNAYPNETIDASAKFDVAADRLSFEESYLSGIIYLARRLDLITSTGMGNLLDRIKEIREKDDEDEAFK